MDDNSLENINILPGISILSVLKHLNYKPWYALAEFVDNSIQSYLDHKEELLKIDRTYKLHVSIEIDTADDGKITIRDNAAGIFKKDYARAFRPAEVPPDSSGLSEFGMGMKSAACWFADKFIVRTGALGEAVAREVYFDVNKIIEESQDKLSVKNEAKEPDIHFTTVILSNLHKPLLGQTIKKIKEHLTSIYRDFLRNNIMDLKINGESLTYAGPEILVAPFYKNESELPVEWKKEINFDFGGGLSVKGFAALLKTASHAYAGFALFRRSRVIEGSGDEPYRPKQIFRDSGGYIYQRLFGELHLEGFDVSHTKDGFRWENNEEVFLELLEEHLNDNPKPLINQALNYRAKARPAELQKAGETATKKTAGIIENEVPKIIESQLTNSPETVPPPAELPKVLETTSQVVKIKINDKPWEITLETSQDPSLVDWVDISDQPSFSDDVWKVGIRMSLVHPFMIQFCGSDPEKIEMALRIAAALVLAEITATHSNVKYAGRIRKNLNEYLRDAFAKPYE